MKYFFSVLLLASFFMLPANQIQSQDQTIVEIAVGNDNFETLVTAVKAAGLVETLSGDGPFTVFAPTDDAFDNLPDGLVAALVKPENKAILQQILTYHVVSGKLAASDVVMGIKDNKNNLQATTVEGSPFDVMLKGDKVMIKDGQGNKAEVVTTDIMASNGVIHVIDRVILPAGVDAAALLAPKKMGMHSESRPMNNRAAETGSSIAQLASDTDQLSTLVTALKAADLVDVFNSNGEFTVFAPTNAAFDALPAGTLAELTKPENKEQLQNILQYHVVFAPISAEALTRELTAGKGYYHFSTLNGKSLVASLENAQVKLTDDGGNSVTVIKTDIMANNGVVHLIDGVLLPK